MGNEIRGLLLSYPWFRNRASVVQCRNCAYWAQQSFTDTTV